MKTSLLPCTRIALLFFSGCGIFSEPDSVLPVDDDPAPPVRSSGPSEPAVPLDGVSMLGGLDCRPPQWALGSGVSRIASPATPAVVANDISSTTRFSHFEVIAPDASEAGGCSIAFFATNAGALTIDASRIVAGNAKAGADGVNPAPTVQGAEADGKIGPLTGAWCNAPSCFGSPIALTGGEGGKSSCGAYEGGTGGSGGV